VVDLPPRWIHSLKETEISVTVQDRRIWTTYRKPRTLIAIKMVT